MDPTHEKSATGCCPRFDPEPWDEKEIAIEDRLFLRDHVRTIFHIPVNFGRVMTRSAKKIREAQAEAPEPLLLCEDKSPWRTEVNIAVSRDVPDAELVRISGKFLAKAFEGPYRNIPKWIRAMQDFVKSRGKAIKKLYFYYTTCPRCAKVYGKNFVVILAEI